VYTSGLSTVRNACIVAALGSRPRPALGLMDVNCIHPGSRVVSQAAENAQPMHAVQRANGKGARPNTGCLMPGRCYGVAHI
jgi:hypothetical protein